MAVMATSLGRESRRHEMTYTADFIKEKLATDDRWLLRGLLAIYKRQTEGEKMAQETFEKNGVGFNGYDCKIMSSFAEFYMNRNYLTSTQTAIVRRRMGKYAGQLAKIANGQI